MRVEFVPPDSVTEPRHRVRQDQAFAMTVGPGSTEWGAKRSSMDWIFYCCESTEREEGTLPRDVNQQISRKHTHYAE